MTPEEALGQITAIVDQINFLNVGQSETQIKNIVSQTTRIPGDPASYKIDQIAGALLQEITIFSAGPILTQIKAILLGGIAQPPNPYPQPGYPHPMWPWPNR